MPGVPPPEAAAAATRAAAGRRCPDSTASGCRGSREASFCVRGRDRIDAADPFGPDGDVGRVLEARHGERPAGHTGRAPGGSGEAMARAGGAASSSGGFRSTGGGGAQKGEANRATRAEADRPRRRRRPAPGRKSARVPPEEGRPVSGGTVGAGPPGPESYALPSGWGKAIWDVLAYPQSARKRGISGTVVVELTVRRPARSSVWSWSSPLATECSTRPRWRRSCHPAPAVPSGSPAQPSSVRAHDRLRAAVILLLALLLDLAFGEPAEPRSSGGVAGQAARARVPCAGPREPVDGS